MSETSMGAAPEAPPDDLDPQDVAAANYLLSAQAVRERSRRLADAVSRGGAPAHFSVHRDRLEVACDRVVAIMRERFPDHVVPLHARWRHFEVGGLDRWGELAAAREWRTREEAARAAADLAILSVLLDAGAGADWHYQEVLTGDTFARSEGLAVASLAMFAAGSFSAVPADPLRVDAGALAALSVEELAAGFQAGPDNPLIGLDGRRDLLFRLAVAMRERPDIFSREDDPRPGGIIDALAAEADGGRLPAPRILAAVLDGLGPIWPGRIVLAGEPLGDAWRHTALADGTAGSDIVPFHKLSQWLSYSLVEPLALRGIEVTDLDGLTGLAEYRNGGLFLDTGVLRLTDPADAARTHDVASPLVVEWRAHTVTLLDDLARMVREALGVDAGELPLGAILEGGTWLAGRMVARELRADGGPPLRIASDGTVF